MPRPRWSWLESTAWLQQMVYDKPDTSSLGTLEIVHEVKDNLFAALIELGEVSGAFHWKSWVNDEVWYDREEIIKELVDVHHFTANILTALGVDDDEWEIAYQAKQLINADRQRDGYKARRKGDTHDRS